jgi:hypothetical protein
MRVRRHGLIKDRITVVPEDKRSEPSHGCVGGTATTDDDDGVSPDTPEIVDPAHRRLDLSVEATDKVAETVGLEGRADYYDTAGALRDMVQNHLLQLLCLVALEPPRTFDADAVRDELGL